MQAACCEPGRFVEFAISKILDAKFGESIDTVFFWLLDCPIDANNKIVARQTASGVDLSLRSLDGDAFD